MEIGSSGPAWEPLEAAREMKMDLVPSNPANADVALVNPPFGSIFMPSIQLGLLKALCARDGVAVDDIYLNLHFAHELGVRLYNAVSWYTGPQMGEWLFGESAFGSAARGREYAARFGSLLSAMSRSNGTSVDALLRLRQQTIPQLVHDSARALTRYRVVGFSSTFQQNVATLALARAIKALRPEVIIVAGGSNMHGVMGEEMFRAFDCLDCVVTGEADHIVGPLFRSLLEGKVAPPFDGVLARATGAGGAPQHTAGGKYPMYPGNMDDLPLPAYATYFDTMRRLGFLDSELGYPIAIPFESSRGCWWGAKNHCTFCGLNTVGMTFRAKSAARVVEEVQALQRAHGIDRFDATDNIIARDSDGALLDGFARLPRKADFFYEIKSNIGPRDAARLAAAGVRRVQPGIESFSTHVLQLMNKGVGGLFNVNALRWLSTFGVGALYNILYGFPEETPEDYRDQLARITHIVHLPPPAGVGKIRLDRFSPNFEREELRRQFHDVQPAESYAYLYPPSVDLERAAYHFEGVAPGAATAETLQPLFKAVDAWKAAWGQGRYLTVPFPPVPADRPQLGYEPIPTGGGWVLDGRQRARGVEHIRLNASGAGLLESFLFRPTPVSQALERLVAAGHRENDLLESLAQLEARGVLLIEGNLGLGLPVLDADAPLVRQHLSNAAPLDRQRRVALPVL